MKKTIFIFCSALLLTGCEQAEDTRHPLFILAEQCRVDQDYAAAERQFRKFLDKRRDSAAGHLALASLYDENLQDPALAIYHYREFLRLDPQSPDGDMVRSWLAAAEAKYREQLNSADLTETEKAEKTEREDRSAEIAALRNQNADLKRMIHRQQQSIAAMQRRLRGENAPPPPVTVKPAAEPAAPMGEARIYRVQSGDTLGLIARKFYGSSSRYELIMEANGLKRNSMLKIGQELKIPPMPK